MEPRLPNGDGHRHLLPAALQLCLPLQQQSIVPVHPKGRLRRRVGVYPGREGRRLSLVGRLRQLNRLHAQVGGRIRSHGHHVDDDAPGPQLAGSGHGIALRLPPI